MAAVEQTIRVGNFIFESVQDSLTAAGSTQGTAFVLGSAGLGAEINRFTTVGAGTGAELPPAQPGMTLLVLNNGANPLQVYGNGGDTINGVAGSTGVPQMVSSAVFYICLTAGAWYTEGLGTGVSGSLPTSSFSNNLTATGSTQAQALAVTTTINEFGTVASGTGAILPASAGGLAITVINNGSNTLKVYPVGTDAINALGTSAAYSMSSPPTVTIFFCTAAGQWWTK